MLGGESESVGCIWEESAGSRCRSKLVVILLVRTNQPTTIRALCLQLSKMAFMTEGAFEFGAVLRSSIPTYYDLAIGLTPVNFLCMHVAW